MFFAMTRQWDKEKILNSYEEANLRAPMLYHWATKTLLWERPITKFRYEVVLDCQKNSPWQNYEKCYRNSMENMPTNVGCEGSILWRRSWEKSKSEPISLSLPAFNIGSGQKTSEMSGVIGFFHTFNVAPELNDIFTIMRAWIFSITWLLWRIC